MAEKTYKFYLFASGGNPNGPLELGTGTLADGKAIVEDLEVRWGEWEEKGFPELDEKDPLGWLEGADVTAVPVEGKDGMHYIFGDADWEEFGEGQ